MTLRDKIEVALVGGAIMLGLPAVILVSKMLAG